MKQDSNQINDESNTQILEFCRHIAGSAKITAINQVERYATRAPKDKATTEITLVIHGFQPRVMRYIKTINQKPLLVLGVDQWIFERDIERGFLGEAIASKLIFPHTALQGEDYLHKQEVALKKRLILELLENLTQSFPELAPRMQIKPQYFLYEVLFSRVRVFPLLAYDFSNVITALTSNEAEALESYNEAIKQLEDEGEICLFNGYVKIAAKLISRSQDPRVRLLNLTKNAPRTIFSSFFGFLPQLVNFISQNNEAFLKTQKINWLKSPDSTYLFIDPQKYVFFETSKGLVSLSDKIDIKGFAQKMLLNGKSDNIKVEPIGGMLNDVYVIDAYADGNETKALAETLQRLVRLQMVPPNSVVFRRTVLFCFSPSKTSKRMRHRRAATQRRFQRSKNLARK